MNFKYVYGAVCAVLVGSALAAEPADEHFLKESIQGNLAEIRLGELAEKKGVSKEVRDFGATLAKDHAAANARAQQTAKSLGVSVPNQPSGEDRGLDRELAALSSDTFDHQFILNMVKDHQKDIAAYEKEASGTSPVADYAKQTLPDLRKHLDTAEHLQQGQRSAKADGDTNMK
jgi:putative membrane protein